LSSFVASLPSAASPLQSADGGAIVGDSDFLPQKFGEAVAHLYYYLKELTLLGSDQGVSGEEERQAVGSFAEFEKL
jgi:hypothetical protein